MTVFRPVFLFFAVCVSASAGDSKSPVPATDEWEYSLSAGPAWRQAGTLSFSGGSRSGGIVIPSFVGSNSLTVPPIGSATELGDRVYDDGFVRTDASTAIDGYTGYWGYRHDSQVAGDNLSMNATGYQSRRTDTLIRGAAAAGDRREQGIAPFLEFDATCRREFQGFRPGFSASFSWLPVRMTRTWRDFTLTQRRDDYRHDWTDTYNLGGYGDEVPSAPHEGTMEGPGFLLENLPDSRTMNEVWIGSESALISNSVITRFHADHSTFSFGPTLKRQLAPEWSIAVGTGVSLHWLHWSASQNERLTLAQGTTRTTLHEWDNASSGDKILGGLYLQLALDWHPKPQDCSLQLLLRGDLGQSTAMIVGPSRLAYDVDGYTVALLFTHAL